MRIVACTNFAIKCTIACTITITCSKCIKKNFKETNAIKNIDEHSIDVEKSINDRQKTGEYEYEK